MSVNQLKIMMADKHGAYIAANEQEKVSYNHSKEVISAPLEQQPKTIGIKATPSQDNDGGPTSATLQKARGRSACYS